MSSRSPERQLIQIDTPILPQAVAEAVVEEIERATRRTLIDRIALVECAWARAEECYAANPQFARKLRAEGNRGRDTLYVFMRHWLASELQRSGRRSLFTAEQFRRLANGEKIEAVHAGA